MSYNVVHPFRYRKPRSSYKYIRPEMQQRHAAFKRGSAYLERYCQLIAFAYYLENVGPETCTYSDWLASRPDLKVRTQYSAVRCSTGALVRGTVRYRGLACGS
jgi:hypothetical protein